MTLKSLLNFGSFGGGKPVPLDRHHSEPSGYYEHGYNHGGHKGGSKGGGSGAALSALTLLAFLFLINVMQQSLQENNATSTTTLMLRETEQPIRLSAKGDDAEVSPRETISTYSEGDYLPVKLSSQNDRDKN